MAILEAYLDESKRTGGKFCVAGFVFAPQQAKKFAKDWRRLHSKLLPCHMTDLATGGGIYKGLSKEARNSLLTHSIEIINERVSMCVIISCDVVEFNALAPKRVRGLRSAYAVCAWLAMLRVGLWLSDEGRSDKVSYVFESGATHQAEADEIIQATRGDSTDPYRYHSHAFLRKEDSVALQSADIMAWEWTKFLDETVDKQIRPSRLSFRALMHTHPNRYIGVHMTGEALRDHMDGLKRLAVDEIPDPKIKTRRS